MKLQRITTQNQELYQFMENLMIQSFPIEEYRDLTELKDFTDHRNQFHCNIIWENDKAIGLLNYWDFDTFYYIEHFAIDESYRNGGIGKRALEYLCKELNGPIILEVEHPDNEIAQRRIRFYERQGFTLWDKPYLQPPYKKGEDFLPLLIMAYGNLAAEEAYKEVKDKLYREVYHAETHK